MIAPVQKPFSPKDKENTFYLLKRLASGELRRHTKALIGAVFCMLMVAGTTALLAWMIQPALDRIFFNKDATMLSLIPLGVIGIALVKGMFTYGQQVLMKSVGQKLVMELQHKLYDHLLHADVTLFNQTASGKLLSRFSNDVYMIRKNVTQIITGLARELVTLVALAGVMFYQSLELSLVAVAVYPLAIYPMTRLGRRMRKVSRKTQEQLGTYISQLDDSFQGIRIVKAHVNEAGESKRARTLLEDIFQLMLKSIRIESAPAPIMETISSVAIAAVIWYGGFKVINGETTAGAFFSFIGAMMMAYRPIKGLTGINTNLQEGLSAIKRIYDVLDAEPKIKNLPDAVPLEVTNGEITFENVSFTYDEGKRALQHVHFAVKPGQKVALVGASGSGKSTMMNLVLRFYDPENGRILIDGQDIRHVTLSSLRHAMAMVNQEATLFDDTVRNNIAYGSPNATEDEIMAAAYSAAAHDFIQELPDGYNTLIGQRGVRLSGGQRQRIAIARAMLKNAPILLLDEATSALDTISEQQIQHALDKLMKGRTSIIIAHRLSTIEHVDTIFVVKDGRIVESGTHKQLLQAGGEYSRLYHREFEPQVLAQHLSHPAVH